MAKKLRKFAQVMVLLAVGSAGGGIFWIQSEIQPAPKGRPFYLHYEKRQRLSTVLTQLADKHAIKNSTALYIYARFTRRSANVVPGTYQFTPGLNPDDVLDRLSRPLSSRVRLPEGFWAARTAPVLEAAHICTAAEYLAAVKHPEQFAKSVPFVLPKGSLEGYLLPDTYELAPLSGAKRVVERQLQAFDRKIWRQLNGIKNPQETLRIASLIELEVKRDDERSIVSGVIQNRLARGMPLEIDASINYGLQEWRPLAKAEYQSVKSPYNLYLNKGLPPGPICSPSLKSIKAALHPAKHNYLYYVAMPDGSSRFAATLSEHLQNVRRRQRLLAQAGRSSR